MRPPDPPFPQQGRVLAVDPGTRRIGLAISDPTRMLATPLDTLEGRGERRDVEAIVAVAREREAAGIVVGLPVNMDGTHGPAYQAAAKLLERIRVQSGLPVAGWDERLTSVQAERTLIAAGVRRKKRRRSGAIDRVAAALILESFLAFLANGEAG